MCVFDNFCEHLKDNGIDIIPRHGNSEIWSEQFSKLNYQPIEFAPETIDYQHAYMSEGNVQITDLSLIILSGGKMCGLWVLTAAEFDNQLNLTSCGHPILAPLFFGSSTRKLEKRFCSNAMKCLGAISKIGFNGPLVIQQGPIGGNKDSLLTEWYRQAMQFEAAVSVKHELYIDLSLSLEEIRSHYRKSYKPFINKGLREWRHSIYTASNIDEEKWNSFKDFHEVVSGRVTRGNASWDAQYRMINSEQAFLIMLYRPEDGKLVGSGFFQHTRNEGFYAVAAYDRGLFGKPLGHVVQQVAIEHMKSLGLRWYKIGERFYLDSLGVATKKEVDISTFKEGFSTNMICKYELTLPKPGN